MAQIPPKRILVPLDFSETSFMAWTLAKDMAKKFNAEIEAIYADDAVVMEMPPFPRRPLTQTIYREIENHLRWRIGQEHRIHIVEGSPVPTILRTARRRRTDMIIMGTHGRTGLPRALFGSVAEAVARVSPVPVLTLRKKWHTVHSILAPINFQKYSIQGFYEAIELANSLDIPLDAIYVEKELPTREQAQTLFNAILARLPLSLRGIRRPRLIIRRGDPVEKVLSASLEYDLVALVAHRKSLLSDLVLGTTAERVLRHCPMPVLSLPYPKKAGYPALYGYRQTPVAEVAAGGQ